MKKAITTFLICLSLAAASQTTDELLSPKQMTITWLGIDFTHFKIKTDKPEIKEYFSDYCYRINKAISEDHSRYYFPVAYKKNFIYNTAYIDSLNRSVQNDIMAPSKHGIDHLDADSIQKIVSGYEFPESIKGVALVYIYDCVVQSGNDWGKIWMAYIDPQTKRILFLQNVTAELNGNSFEVQMAYPALQMLREVKSHFNKWALDPDKYSLSGKEM